MRMVPYFLLFCHISSATICSRDFSTNMTEIWVDLKEEVIDQREVTKWREEIGTFSSADLLEELENLEPTSNGTQISRKRCIFKRIISMLLYQQHIMKQKYLFCKRTRRRFSKTRQGFKMGITVPSRAAHTKVICPADPRI